MQFVILIMNNMYNWNLFSHVFLVKSILGACQQTGFVMKTMVSTPTVQCIKFHILIILPLLWSVSLRSHKCGSFLLVLQFLSFYCSHFPPVFITKWSVFKAEIKSNYVMVELGASRKTVPFLSTWLWELAILWSLFRN